MGPDVSAVYLQVVEDVINNVRADFQSDGVEEHVLNELQQLWESKLQQSGAIEGDKRAGREATGSGYPQNAGSVAGRAGGLVPATPVHDLNVPYEHTEDYEAPTAEYLFPPTPSIGGTPEIVMQYNTAPAEPDSGLGLEVKLGRPDPYMAQPASWMNQKPRGVDVNIAYEEGEEEEENGHEQAPVTKDFFTLAPGKRKRDEMATSYLPGPFASQSHRDGVGDIGLQLYSSRTQTAEDGASEWNAQKMVGRNSDQSVWKQDMILADSRMARMAGATHTSGASDIPQLDGINDDYDDGVVEEDYNQPAEEEAQPAQEVSRAVKNEPVAVESEGSEPPLNEDDDEDLDENDQGDVEPTTEDIVLAQFDKVTRSKNKWKCMLKDGIMHLNGKDILFVKANGEFEF